MCPLIRTFPSDRSNAGARVSAEVRRQTAHLEPRGNAPHSEIQPQRELYSPPPPPWLQLVRACAQCIRERRLPGVWRWELA